jgi:hypothetical protein
MKENQASSTAFTVLQGILYIAQHPRHAYLVPKEVVEVAQQILAASAPSVEDQALVSAGESLD